MSPADRKAAAEALAKRAKLKPATVPTSIDKGKLAQRVHNVLFGKASPPPPSE